MKQNGMIYFDNAATTFPKPPSVHQEVKKCLTSYCGNAGRGSHSMALAASNKIFECREEISKLFNAPALENVIFTYNTTYALNLVIKGLARHGDHILISDLEHNSVYRPVVKLARERGIEYDIFKTNPLDSCPKDDDILKNIESKIKRNTRLLICNHSSNICSKNLPLFKIGELCKRRKIAFVVDAAQSAGRLEIDMQKMNISALCMPGHKALYGIQGCGIVCLDNDITLDTLVEGGNGINSKESTMPSFSPERYESGTLATPCIAGLYEGIKAITSIGIDNIQKYENELYLYLLNDIQNIPMIKIYAKDCIGSTMLFNIGDLSPDHVASILNKNKICVRPGFHCCALGHEALGTSESGGVRVSFGIFNTRSEIKILLDKLNAIAKGKIL